MWHKQNVRPVLNVYRKYEITLMYIVWYFLFLHKMLDLIALETESEKWSIRVYETSFVRAASGY